MNSLFRPDPWPEVAISENCNPSGKPQTARHSPVNRRKQPDARPITWLSGQRFNGALYGRRLCARQSPCLQRRNKTSDLSPLPFVATSVGNQHRGQNPRKESLEHSRNFFVRWDIAKMPVQKRTGEIPEDDPAMTFPYIQPEMLLLDCESTGQQSGSGLLGPVIFCE